MTTPALLFPAISLLMLAYTNRFIVLAGLVRELYAQHKEEADEALAGQILNLRRRIVIIKNMQIFGALSFFSCVGSMFLVFAGSLLFADMAFGLSLLLLLVSLGLLIQELHLSIHAIDIQLKDFSTGENAERQ